jgi:4-hydroxythreonine-4-phosphate dehydrogenase
MGHAFDAVVTLPIQKSTIIESGWPDFRGHTEYLAERTGTLHVVMLLAASAAQDALRVALATTHLPLAAVPGAITTENVLRCLRILNADLTQKWRITQPRILVAGLNPHAGEAGHLGHEDDEVIAPAIAAARAEAIDAIGPLPADTLFTPRALKGADAVLAMYHDQGLPVLKFASFGGGINVTLGLPIIRTSVDHGTALDIAGKGMADAGSFVAALKLAIDLANRRAP